MRSMVRRSAVLKSRVMGLSERSQELERTQVIVGYEGGVEYGLIEVLVSRMARVE